MTVKQLQKIKRRVDKAEAEFVAALAERQEAIEQAIDDGMKATQIANALQMSRSRISQLLRGP